MHGKRPSAGNDVAWLEKLTRASSEALERVRKLDDPFARDLANDLKSCPRTWRGDWTRRAPPNARRHDRPSLRRPMFSRLRPRGRSYSLLIVPIMLAAIAIAG